MIFTADYRATVTCMNLPALGWGIAWHTSVSSIYLASRLPVIVKGAIVLCNTFRPNKQICKLCIVSGWSLSGAASMAMLNYWVLHCDCWELARSSVFCRCALGFVLCLEGAPVLCCSYIDCEGHLTTLSFLSILYYVSLMDSMCSWRGEPNLMVCCFLSLIGVKLGLFKDYCWNIHIFVPQKVTDCVLFFFLFFFTDDCWLTLCVHGMNWQLKGYSYNYTLMMWWHITMIVRDTHWSWEWQGPGADLTYPVHCAGKTKGHKAETVLHPSNMP